MSKYPRGTRFGERLNWESMLFGTFICWTNNIPFGTDIYADNRASAPFSVSGWAPSGVDVNDWVDFSDSIGAQYSVLVVKHNMGWNLFPFQTNIASHTGKDSYNATISLPQVTNYGVNNAAIVGTADQDIVHQFVARCRTTGVRPVLYYNIGKDINARGGFADVATSAFSADTDISDGYPLYAAMVEAHMKELLEAFPGIWLWLDAPAWYPRAYHQSLFDTIRKYGDENTLIIYNYNPLQGSGNVDLRVKPTGTHADYQGSLTGTSLYLFPFDIASYEFSRLPANVSTELLRYQSHLKNIFWRGGEIVTPIFTNGQYFYWDQAIVGGTPNTLEALATLTALADTANDSFAPLLLALCPDETGVISAAQKTRATDVATHIFT